MTVFARRQIFGKRFGIFGGSLTMDAGRVFLDHVGVGKFKIGRRLFDMAFGGAIHPLDFGVRDTVQADVAIFALELSVNR